MSVKELVENAIETNKVTIFSKSWCPYCRRAKAIFSQKFPEVEAKIFELDQMEEGEAMQDYLYEKTKQRTVPNVFVAGNHIGGSDDVADSFHNGKLKELMAA